MSKQVQEAPSKIYVQARDGKTITLNKVFDNDICYIRKDTLLEKIDDAIAHLSDGSLTGYYESLAYKDIRELIESM